MADDILSATRYTDRRFDRAVMTGRRLTAAEFAATTFQRCHFAEAVLERCRFVDCVFDESDLTMVQVPECRFSNVTFRNTRLVGIDWTRAEWPRLENTKPIRLLGCVLNHSTFIGLKLREVEFVDCTANDVDFREADLGQASFSNTDLAESIFLKTDLTRADFSRARNYRIDPTQNKIAKARFSLPEALSLLYSMDIEMVGEITEPGDPA